MDKLNLILEAERYIPKDILYTTILVHGEEKAFELFLENDFINFINDNNNMSGLELAKWIINKFGKNLKPSEAVKSIHSFIEAKQNYSNTVKISTDTYFDFKKFLLNNIKHINSNNEIELITTVPYYNETRVQKLSFEHLYEQHINATYKEQTLEDKLETINHYIEIFTTDEILSAEYKDGMTFKQYLTEVIPNEMNKDSEIEYIDESGIKYNLRIDDFIEKESQKILNQLEMEKTDINNRIYENPTLVKEIDAGVELGGEIPILENISHEDYLYSSLELIRNAIYNALTIEHLTKLVNEFKLLCSSLDDNSIVEYKNLVESINELIDTKAKNITIRGNNKVDFANYIIEELINIESNLQNNFDYHQTMDFDKRLTTIKMSLVENNIYNQAIMDKIKELDNIIEWKRNLYKLESENNSLDHRRAINELDLLIMDIKNKASELLFVDNEIKKASIEVKLEGLINDFNIKKDALYKEHHISMEEIIEYNDRLDNVLNEEGEKEYERRV